jgi:hypothetical protein
MKFLATTATLALASVTSAAANEPRYGVFTNEKEGSGEGTYLTCAEDSYVFYGNANYPSASDLLHYDRSKAIEERDGGVQFYCANIGNGTGIFVDPAVASAKNCKCVTRIIDNGLFQADTIDENEGRYQYKTPSEWTSTGLVVLIQDKAPEWGAPRAEVLTHESKLLGLQNSSTSTPAAISQAMKLEVGASYEVYVEIGSRDYEGTTKADLEIEVDGVSIYSEGIIPFEVDEGSAQLNRGNQRRKAYFTATATDSVLAIKNTSSTDSTLFVFNVLVMQTCNAPEPVPGCTCEARDYLRNAGFDDFLWDLHNDSCPDTYYKDTSSEFAYCAEIGVSESNLIPFWTLDPPYQAAIGGVNLIRNRASTNWGSPTEWLGFSAPAAKTNSIIGLQNIASGTFSSVEQEMNLMPGREYKIYIEATSRAYNSDPKGSLLVTADGVTLGTISNIDYAVADTMPQDMYSVTYTATSGPNKLKIQNTVGSSTVFVHKVNVLDTTVNANPPTNDFSFSDQVSSGQCKINVCDCSGVAAAIDTTACPENVAIVFDTDGLVCASHGDINCSGATAVQVQHYYETIDNRLHVDFVAGDGSRQVVFSAKGANGINIVLANKDSFAGTLNETGLIDLFVGGSNEPFVHFASCLGCTPESIVSEQLMSDDSFDSFIILTLTEANGDTTLTVSKSTFSEVEDYKYNNGADGSTEVASFTLSGVTGLNQAVFTYGYGDLECSNV